MNKKTKGLNRREMFRLFGGIGLGAIIAETYDRLYNIPLLESRFREEVIYWLSQYNTAKQRLDELPNQLKQSEGEVTSLREKVSNLENLYKAKNEEVKKLDELEKESTSAIAYYRERMDDAINNLRKTIERYRAILGDDRVAFESSTVKILEDLKLTQEKLQKVLPYFPLVSNFAWKPTKIINDKIYDIKVSFEVISPLNSLREVEVMLIPVDYRYFITKYGMREEDYDKVFPKEEIRSVKIEPKNLEREIFSVDFGDLKGGREYIVKARVEDIAGSEKIVEVKTHYIREFENLGKELYEKVIIVGASYMSGYYPWQTGKTPDDYPLLGKYDAADEIAQWKHVDWAGYAGINVFFIDAGAWEDWKISGKEGNIMRGLMDKGMKCAFLYDPWGDYFKRGTNPNAPKWAIDLTYSTNKKNFVDQLSTNLNSKLVDHPNYFSFNGKPVVFLYDAAAYINEKEAFKELRNSINKDVLFFGDTLLKIPALPQDSDWYFKLKDFSNYDWISTWVGFVNADVARSYSTNYDELYYRMLDMWSKWVEKIGKAYVSSVIPGFKYIWESFGIQRRLDRIQNQLLYSLEKTKLIRIDTWNDFAENTFVEPSLMDGFNYINKIHDILVKKIRQK
jgi:hypothetical protein